MLKSCFIKALGIFRKLCIYLHYVGASTNLAETTPNEFEVPKIS